MAICNYSLVAEISTVFLNLMAMFKKDDYETLKAISQVIFFVLFTLLRILMWPFLIYVVMCNMVYCWPEADLAAKSVMLVTFVQYFALYLL